MASNGPALIGMALVVMSLAAFPVYRWWQQRRVHKVEAWVKEYLFGRYGELPNDLHIDCSYDRLWPVLVTFDTPHTGLRHSMQFDCGRAQPAWLLVSEGHEQR
jgi:hypothetical protein